MSGKKFEVCKNEYLMWLPLFQYPEDKLLIKESVQEMLKCEGYNLQEYIKYLVEMNELSTLQTIEEYWEDFRLTQEKRDALLGIITLLKLSPNL